MFISQSTLLLATLVLSIVSFALGALWIRAWDHLTQARRKIWNLDQANRHLRHLAEHVELARMPDSEIEKMLADMQGTADGRNEDIVPPPCGIGLHPEAEPSESQTEKPPDVGCQGLLKVIIIRHVRRTDTGTLRLEGHKLFREN